MGVDAIFTIVVGIPIDNKYLYTVEKRLFQHECCKPDVDTKKNFCSICGNRFKLEEVKIPKDIDFRQLKSLSSEAVEKLTKIQPATIGQASRISGITPSDVSILLIYLGR
jgi:hypothetical protein